MCDRSIDAFHFWPSNQQIEKNIIPQIKFNHILWLKHEIT